MVQKAIIRASQWRGVVSSTYDSDAIEFFLSVEADGSSLTTTHKSAINQLVLDLKTYSLWSGKFFALWPLVGGTASTHKWNLVNPVDSPTAYRLNFYNSPTHDSNGVAFNGTSQYIDTNFVPSTSGMVLTNGHMSFYSRMSGQSNGGSQDMGMWQSAVQSLSLGIRRSSDLCFAELYDETDWIESTNTNGAGLFLANRPNNTTLQFVRNGTATIQETNTTVGSLPTIPVIIGAANTNSGIAAYSNRPCSLASIGNGMSATELTNFYTAVQAYQTTLSRQV
jgi:hypothetical protein